MAEVKPEIETFAKIKVLGVGGGGGSALNRMIVEKLRGVDFVAVNTDVQALHQNLAPSKISIGKTVTRGLGAGMNPDLGRRAAEENANDIRNAIAGSDMVFLTAGLGGGTGSGALAEIAKIAREAGALTVAVVTKPFTFEGAQRKRIADDAFNELSEHVDTIITIPNDRVLQIIDKKTSLLEAFQIVDDVLRQGVQGISEIITLPGLINVDFADVKAIMQNAGSALMGIGSSTGENRAVDAAKMAIASPLLELSIDGAKGILFTVTGSPDLAMYEVAEAAKVITGSADDDAKVIFGANIDDTLEDEVRITVVATGFDRRERRSSPGLAGDVEVAPHGSWTPTARENYSKTGVVTGQAKDSMFEQRRVPVESDPFEEKFSPSFSSTTSSPSASSTSDKDDEDLGIPAFIRRKMM
ncbi:MAG: cell division protein FtsZ [Candidatus Uhrbacteria bacterium]|nr:cell division protein FtsZ [Candidatus Uhrbacteria bacterium]